MTQTHPGLRALAGLVASALLLGAYACGGWGFLLGFVALVPWLISLQGLTRGRSALLSAWMMSIAFVVTTFSWFAFAIADYLGMAPLTAMSVMIIAAPLLQPQFIAYALVRRLVMKRFGTWLGALAGAAAWIALEWLWPKLLGDTLGHGLYPALHMRQFADVAGAAGLSFLLILVNEATASAWLRRRGAVRAWAAPLGLAASIPLLLTAYGAVRLSMVASLDDAVEAPLLRVGMVQSNIVDYDRLRAEIGGYEVLRRVLDTHFSLSYAAAKAGRVDALLWSETVCPTTFGQPKSDDGAAFDREIIDFVDAAQVPLVFGTYDADDAGEYNAAAFVAPGEPPLGFYRKTRLFLFTEFLPAWLDQLGLRSALPWAGRWQSGSGARVMPLRLADGREIPVQVLICLDDVDPMLAINGARLGAEVLLGMSNDSWFTKQPLGAQLHLQVAAFRSIETRLPQLRVTSNGTSAAVDATGTITASVGMNEQALLVGEVRARPAPFTLMLAWGDWLGKVAIVFLIGLAGLSVVSHWRERHPSARGLTDQTLPLPERMYVMTPTWRAIAASLRALSRIAVLWMLVAWWLGAAGQDRVLTQLRTFAWWVLLPEVMAWLILRAHSVKVSPLEAGHALNVGGVVRRLVAAKHATLKPWVLPLPAEGANVELDGVGKRAFAGVDPAMLAATLGAAIDNDPRNIGAFKAARARGLARHRWLDHPILKFVVYPLLPALIAFRLHQMITYGGMFGEAMTHGWEAWFAALGIWWARWTVAMVLWAGVLRLLVELASVGVLRWAPGRLLSIRTSMEMIARVLYFLGVPLWLVWRITSG